MHIDNDHPMYEGLRNFNSLVEEIKALKSRLQIAETHKRLSEEEVRMMRDLKERLNPERESLVSALDRRLAQVAEEEKANFLAGFQRGRLYRNNDGESAWQAYLTKK
ncbi:hypothetical protein KAI10_05235 [Candidatus Bathyarchaeota archaeon]|nr:hypothetical protein [Candidatus Bathyarchaeota archaeon]